MLIYPPLRLHFSPMLLPILSPPSTFCRPRFLQIPHMGMICIGIVVLLRPLAQLPMLLFVFLVLLAELAVVRMNIAVTPLAVPKEANPSLMSHYTRLLLPFWGPLPIANCHLLIFYRLPVSWLGWQHTQTMW